MKRVRSSIQAKVFLVVAAQTFLLVAFLTTYFPARQMASAREVMLTKAATYALLVSRQVESGIAFDDRETVREVFSATAEDVEVRALALRRSDGRLLHTYGDFTGSVVPLGDDAAPDTVRLEETPAYVRGIAPVVSKEGPTGTLIIEFSTEALQAERARIQRVAFMVGAAGLAAGLITAWLIGRLLSKRLRLIASATSAVAEGDLSERALVDDSPDEVGQLARSFTAMFAYIRSLLDEIQETNAREKERLEVLVRLRTTELRARNKDMRTVFDNVSQGFLTLDRAGIVGPEHSRALETWFGAPTAGTTLWDYLTTIDPVLGWRMKVGWDAVVEDFLPIELAVDQLPNAATRGDRHFSIYFQPIVTDGVASRFLVVFSDVTNIIERENSDAAEREVFRILDRVAKDRAGFVAFMAEGESLVRKIVESTEPSADVRRWVHTLKGNAGVFGLLRIAKLCHAIEDGMGQSARGPSPADRAALAERWRELSTKLGTLLRETPTDMVEIREAEYAWLLDGLAGSVSRGVLLRAVASWQLESGERPIQRLADQARGIATRLGKRNVHVITEANGLRFDAARWTPFWSALTHTVRNALDHGIEPAAERARFGKMAAGTLTISARASESELTIEVADDGRGIDWAELAASGRRLGVLESAEPTPAELEQLLFIDGLSTKREVNMMSGRGVGLSASHAACLALGGKVSVRSEPGHGTTFSFVFPPGANARVDLDLIEDSPDSRAA